MGVFERLFERPVASHTCTVPTPERGVFERPVDSGKWVSLNAFSTTGSDIIDLICKDIYAQLFFENLIVDRGFVFIGRDRLSRIQSWEVACVTSALVSCSLRTSLL